MGRAQDILLAVVYTDRIEADGEVNRRIISARKGNRRERKIYEKEVSTE